jgi:hypothetical protein
MELAKGFEFTEATAANKDGHVFFSDPHAHRTTALKAHGFWCRQWPALYPQVVACVEKDLDLRPAKQTHFGS